MIRSVLLLGGTGFIGGHVAQCLVAQGHRVVVPTRRLDHGRPLMLLPTVDVIEADVNDPARLAQLVSKVDTVINLVGVLHSRSAPSGGPSYGPQFASAHVELARKVVVACKQVKVPRLIHVSALGADPHAPSEYLRSKAAGEEAIRAAGHEPAWTIFRPSVVFGAGDSFLSLFAELARVFPVLPLAGANTRFQPVYVNDVAGAICQSIGNDSSIRQTIDLAGPEVYALRELVQYVCELMHLNRRIIPLSGAAATLQATILGMLPGKLMTRDNLRSLQVDNVTRGAPLPFGMRATPLEAIAPTYIGRHHPRASFNALRRHAGR